MPGSPNSLAVGPDGEPYATEAYAGHVWKLDWNGNVVAEMGGFGLLVAERQFRKVIGHKQIPLLLSSMANAVSKQSIAKGAKVA